MTSKLPWYDKDGNVIGTFGISKDITALKQTEEKLAEYTRQLERKNRQTEEELKMARELQLAMLPHEFPCMPRRKPREESNLEFFSFFFPSGAVSGDFFDVIPLSDTTVGLFICDVMGHDVRAALVTAMMRALVVDLSATTTEPGDLLTQINREVAGVFKQTDATMYATAFYLIADVARAELRFASAAHPEPSSCTGARAPSSGWDTDRDRKRARPWDFSLRPVSHPPVSHGGGRPGCALYRRAD